MAGNLWDNLDDAQRQAVIEQGLAGQKKTPENSNRLREQLTQNPTLVEKLAQEAGVLSDEEMAELQGPDDVGDNQSMDAAVDASLQESGDMQQPGDMSKTGNADLEQRVRMLERRLGTPNTDETLSTRRALDEGYADGDVGTGMRLRQDIAQQGGIRRGPVQNVR